MSTRLFRFLVMLLAIGYTASGDCDELSPCPAKTRVSSGALAIRDLPAGYKGFVPDSPVFLTGVSVYDGPPAEGALLKPSEISSKGQQITWELDSSSARGTWLSCDYAAGLVKLVKKLEKPASRCTATVTQSKSPQGMAGQFICKP